MDCSWNGSRFKLQEVHRFPNSGVRFGSNLYWDVLRIWSEIQTGLKKFNLNRKQNSRWNRRGCMGCRLLSIGRR